MYLPRPPVVLAACWMTGVLVCVVNAHSPVLVPASPQQSATKILASTGETPLSDALAPSRAWAQTPDKAAASLIPTFTRIIISLPADISFEGTGAPGDEITLYIDGDRTVATRVDGEGQWRVALAQSLPPGDYAAMAVATSSPGATPKSSEEVRIAIPQLAPPVYAPPDTVSHADVEPPNAATRRRAAELARDANSYFDKLTAEKPTTSKSDQRGQVPERNDGDIKTSEPRNSYSGIAGWFARARREYNEVLVAGLSDPNRRGSIAQNPEQDLAVKPPLPERPDDGVSYIQIAMNWLQQANREYQEQLVDQLKRRGAAERLAVREKAPADGHTDVAALSNQTEQPAEEATTTKAGREVDEKRLAALKTEEERQASETRRLEEDERRAAEAAERQRVAAETKALARRAAEEQRQVEEERQRVAHSADQESGNVRALKELLAEREKFPAPTEMDAVTIAPTLRAAQTDETAHSQPAQPELSVAPEAKASQSHVAEAVPATADITAEDVASIALPEAKPRQLSHREQTVSLPPVPEARRIVAAAVPMPGEKPDRQSAIDVRVAERDVNGSSKREGEPALDRYRWCSNPRAGRTITPPGTYIVAYGDTLWGIAERHYNAGYLYKRIRRANRRKIRHSRWIYPCQRLWLPRLRVHRR